MNRSNTVSFVIVTVHGNNPHVVKCVLAGSVKVIWVLLLDTIHWRTHLVVTLAQYFRTTNDLAPHLNV